ncbi:hypothetical protein VQ045_11545, partial [Aurantimonas sp. E1-2-R+4]|uniref:hypothetical protein n=1 Tax=Aurantimonas sp. E1-2-R+4 TaxID=3113714 RepID=UPI002F95EE04
PAVCFRPHRFHALVESNQQHGITNDSYHSTSLWTDTKEQYDQKIKLIAQIFSLVDERVVASRNYATVLESLDVDRVNSEREKYREIVGRWNRNISGLLIQTKTAFSPQVCYDMDRYFLPEFSSLDAKLRAIREWEEPIEERFRNLQEVRESLNDINIEARELSTQLLYRARDERAFVEQRPRISWANRDVLTHIYLFKSLFKPRTYTDSV